MIQNRQLHDQNRNNHIMTKQMITWSKQTITWITNLMNNHMNHAMRPLTHQWWGRKVTSSLHTPQGARRRDTHWPPSAPRRTPPDTPSQWSPSSDRAWETGYPGRSTATQGKRWWSSPECDRRQTAGTSCRGGMDWHRLGRSREGQGHMIPLIRTPEMWPPLLIRTLSLVPRVAGLEEFHCNMVLWIHHIEVGKKNLGGRSHDIVVTMDTSCRGEVGWEWKGDHMISR